jgi:hypothetical protein
MELICNTYFDWTRQLRITDRLMTRMIHLTIIILSMTVYWHALSTYLTGTYKSPQNISPSSLGAWIQYFTCLSRLNTRLPVAFKYLEDNFLFSSAEVQSKEIIIIQAVIRTEWKVFKR